MESLNSQNAARQTDGSKRIRYGLTVDVQEPFPADVLYHRKFADTFLAVSKRQTTIAEIGPSLQSQM